MAEELGEKTEAPSGRKLSEARNRGNIPRSLDLSGAVDLVGAVVLTMFFGEDLVSHLGSMLRESLAGTAPGGDLDGDVRELIAWSGARAARAAAPILAAMTLVAYAAQFMQVGWLVTLEPIQPKLDRLNPIAGLGRIFGRRNVVKTLVSVVKLTLIAVVVVLAVRKRLRELAFLPSLDLLPAFRLMGDMIIEMAAWMLLLMLVIGVADYAYQLWQHHQDLKMTKQEVKDERRNAEGDLDTKGRRIKMARQMLLQQARSAVPQANVVVTNPTHFAVALRYDPETMAAPRVVAKGGDYMAFRIREIAAAHGVPIVEKPPLARALYANVQVGQEVRPEFYEAVAEVLAYVYRLNQHAAA